MRIFGGSRQTTARGFLGRLRRDARGNALAIMAAMLVPLTLFAGSAVDVARMYTVKARLQQACDAGVLAGRKFMTNPTAATLDSTAAGRAQTFFTNNFRSGWFQTTSVSFTPSKTTDNQVAGVALATVPMSIMKMFGFASVPLTANCEARYDVADLDLMFVLDNTGSMACAAADKDSDCDTYVVGNTTTYSRADGTIGYTAVEKSNARIKALRSSVLDFYDTLADNADDSTNIRYGFVTYTSTVNVGKVLYRMNSNYLISGNYPYQSRYVLGDAISTTSGTNGKTQANCSGGTARSPATGYNTSTGTATSTSIYWQSGNCYTSTSTYSPNWRYSQVNYNVANYVTGAQVDDPSKVKTETAQWQGCIEERKTTPGVTNFSQSNLPPDLDPDLVPSSDDTRWRPMWPEVIYTRGNNAIYVDNASDGAYPNIGKDPAYLKYHIFYSCGKEAQRLATLTRSQVSAYVNAADFKPWGNTYHDTGMIWGTRMISPTGLFAADTQAWTGHNAPNRHIIFMTDGVMEPYIDTYGMYGVERYDKRVTNGDTGNQATYHNARFVAACNAAKARNITVWVIAFGSGVTTAMSQCATDSAHVFPASNDAALDAAFTSIAQQVAMLRISK